MKVTLVASTTLRWPGVDDAGLVDNEFGQRNDFTRAADWLAEFSGRACYKSWDLPNSKTATNEGYLANIIEHQHFSVLEHASATFYVEHVSRSLLTELTRHRHLSFSVESQRYVDQAMSHPDPVIPPGCGGDDSNSTMADELRFAYDHALTAYTAYYTAARKRGLSVKEARGLARAALPNCTPVDLVVTGNMRAWRDMLAKRLSPAAEVEIRELARLILAELKKIAPNTFQDMEP